MHRSSFARHAGVRDAVVQVLGCSLITLVIFSPARAFIGSLDEGNGSTLRVGKISIDQRNIFDEDDSTFFRVVSSVANSVHVLTNGEVIRREILLKEGDPLDQRLLLESEQNIRRLGVMGDVTIVCDTLPDNTVDITVKTRDRWTMRPAVALRQEGKRDGFSLSLREENFLGSAQKLRLGYQYLPGVGSPHGGELGFTEPRLWGSRWTATVHYGVSDELRIGAFNIERPFFSDSAPWAARLYADVARTRWPEYRNGAVTLSRFFDRQTQLAWVAYSSVKNISLHLAGGYFRMRTHYPGYRPGLSENVDLVIGSVGLLKREYVRTGSPDLPGRTEDVHVGYQGGVALGRNLRFTKAGSADYFFKVFGQRSLAFGEKLFASYQMQAMSYLDRWVLHEATVSGIALHHWRMSEGQSLTARVATAIGSRWMPYNKMVLGASTGLRGYPHYAFFGHRMLLMNFEHRILSLVRIWFLKVGGVLFFDSGAMWDQDQDLARQRFHSSAGLGLRLNVMGGIFRLDAAYNFDRRAISCVVSANQIFRVFAPLDFSPPVPGQPLR